MSAQWSLSGVKQTSSRRDDTSGFIGAWRMSNQRSAAMAIVASVAAAVEASAGRRQATSGQLRSRRIM